MSSDQMSLGDRMKMYERHETARSLLEGLPIVMRLDGRCFHTFTRGLAKPYDIRMSTIMQDVARQLLTFSKAVIVYTQSDEITAILYNGGHESQTMFNGEVFKLTSIMAGFVSAAFNKLLPERIPEKARATPVFDCRVFVVPSLSEAANCLVWRQIDAKRNSIEAAAHAVLHKKDTKTMLAMLNDADIYWENYPPFFRHGVYYRSTVVQRKLTVEELSRLPEKHNARTNPDLVFSRPEIAELDMYLPQVSNKTGVVFGKEEPCHDE